MRERAWMADFLGFVGGIRAIVRACGCEYRKRMIAHILWRMGTHRESTRQRDPNDEEAA
ncbi:MAG TPA: hypothetical protein VM619_06640 [Luteimonas sp.]|nr:hypothetical protein [Luteimonas sp.]